MKDNWGQRVYQPGEPEDIDYIAMKREMTKVAGYTCESCRKKFPQRELTLHHVIPRCEGGPTEPDNLIVVCNPCHNLIEPLEFRTKVHIRYYAAKTKLKIKRRPIVAMEKQNDWHQWVYGGCRNPQLDVISTNKQP